MTAAAGPRRWRRVGLWALAVVIVAFAGWLIFPGTPSQAKSLKFQGYVALPGHRALNVLDYLTVNGRNLFVTSATGGEVYKIALDTPFSGVVVLAGPPAAHGVAIDPASGVAYVSRSEANTVDLFDPRAMRLIKRIGVADDVDGIFYDPASKLIVADSGDPKLATLIDPTSQTKAATIPLGGVPEFAAFDPQASLLYQNLKDVDAVVALDLAKRSVTGRWPLEGCQAPSGMAIDARQRRLFVVCSGNAKLVVFDLDSHRVTSVLLIGGGPDSVAYDAALHRLYATGKSGVLSVIAQDTPDHYRPLDQIRLHYGAHTLAVDPVTHRVYVGYASLLLPARLAVFSAVG